MVTGQIDTCIILHIIITNSFDVTSNVCSETLIPLLSHKTDVIISF